MGTFLSHPLKVVCRDTDEIRAFLATCRYVSDREQFGVEEHWMPPEEFEQTRKGDCVDFALWTWRQLLGLGYNARFVGGVSGRYGAGHAWVTFPVHGKTFLLEPQMAFVSGTFPRLDTLRYKPDLSIEAIGTHIKFFEHAGRTTEPLFRDLAPFVLEWLGFRLGTIPRAFLRAIFHSPGAELRRR